MKTVPRAAAYADLTGGYTFVAPGSPRFDAAIEQTIPASSCFYGRDGSWLVAASHAHVALNLFRQLFPHAPIYAVGASPEARNRQADAQAAIAHHTKEAA